METTRFCTQDELVSFVHGQVKAGVCCRPEAPGAPNPTSQHRKCKLRPPGPRISVALGFGLGVEFGEFVREALCDSGL